MSKKWNVGIYVFDEVEVLDFAGPFEVFGITELEDTKEKLFNVSVVSQFGTIVQARNGLKIQPDFNFVDVPSFDVLIIPGGYGAEELEIKKPEVIDWIKDQYKKVKIICSVCTGAFLLAKAGLLDEKRATTHWMDVDNLGRDFPKVKVIRNTRYVDEGNIITSAGISSGIHMSLHVVRRLVNEEVALTTAKRMEYDVTTI